MLVSCSFCLFLGHLVIAHALRLAKLLGAVSGGFHSAANDILQAVVLKAHQRGVGGAVGAGDVLPQLGGVLGGLDQHLSGTESSLLGQASGLLLGETQAGSGGDEVLDKGEEVGGARALGVELGGA